MVAIFENESEFCSPFASDMETIGNIHSSLQCISIPVKNLDDRTIFTI
jgi:hypothetical protein